MLMAQRNPNFDYKKCTFKVEKCKENTGRVVCFKQLRIRHSFTLESSFFGRGGDHQMSIPEYEQIGRDVGMCLLNFIAGSEKKVSFIFQKMVN